MAKSRPLTIVFPTGGVSKRYGYHKQAPFTTPSADNVWPTEWETGRERGGVRPGVEEISDSGGTPYNWCEANSVDGVGIAVTSSSGTKYTYTGTSWSSGITTPPSDNFASCTVYLQDLYQAVSGSTVKVKPLVDSSFFALEATAGMTPGDTSSVVLLSGPSLINPDPDPPDPLNPPLERGTAPLNCGLITTWGDRLVLAGDSIDPQIVYMSAIGDPKNWDYSAVAANGAWANSGATAGHIGENITSLINHNQDCLLIGCTDSIYAVRGNPRLSSIPVYSLSSTVGPLMQSAWCKTGNDFTVMMTRDGLYSMRPGCGEPPVSMSREVLPEELTAIDPGRQPTGDTVSIGYDARWRGIHIYVKKDGVYSAWFYDMQSKGYWPMSFTGKSMAMAVNFKKISSERKGGLLAVTSTGGANQFDLDSTENISSHLYYGPIAIGSPHTEGVLSEITAVLTATSEPAKWEIYTGDSPQEAFHSATPSFSGDDWVRQGLNYTQNPLVRGSALYVKVIGINDGLYTGRWSIEEIPAVVRQAGRRRVG